MLNKYQNILAWVLGFGIVSFAFRDFYFSGTIIGISLCLIVLFLSFVLIINSKDRPRNILGSKFIYIPLIIIVLSIISSGLIQFVKTGDSNTLFARIAIAILFFGVYLTSRILGDKIFKPFVIAVVLDTIAIIIWGLVVRYGVHNGGGASYTNYNIATALLVFGSVVSIFYKQWIVVTIALVGLFFTGAEEAIIVIGVMFLVVLIRRDFSKRLLASVGILMVVILLGIFPFNYTKRLYAIPIDKVSILFTQRHNSEALAVIEEQPILISDPTNFINKYDYYLDGRVEILQKWIDNFNPLGSGYVMNPVDKVDYPVYNVPLVIVEQIGIIGALAWVFVMIYCLIKTKWKYAFISLIALGIFDNFVWCQLGLWIPALIGVSTVSIKSSDLIFKEIRNV